MSPSHEADDIGPGGYDAGYRQCACFWGTSPSRLVVWLSRTEDLKGSDVLDLGCGEGKNATFLARQGCNVEAWDISQSALANGMAMWPSARVKWLHRDAITIADEARSFDIVIAYGLLHCLRRSSIDSVIVNMKRVTNIRGYNIIVCYNDRLQYVGDAHPGFHPTYISHQLILDTYHDWQILYSSDEDLFEKHPTNNVPHTHSMTRLLARKPNST
jgi:tellurite methyltransferase